MADKKNLCAIIPADLHARVRQEQEQSGRTLSEFVEQLITDYYKMKEGTKMTGDMRTMAIQLPEELFERLKAYLKKNNLKQKQCIIGLIEDALEQDEEDPKSQNDFGKNVLPAMLNAGEAMYAYRFEGYWKDVGTVQSLWEANMDLISDDPPIELNAPDWRIYSKSPCMHPHCVGGNATIKRSSITEGCNIYGTVMHSVIFAGVDIEEGAEVVDSVVMPGAVIRSGAKVHRAIIGENSIVGEGSFVGAERRPEDGEYNTSLTDDITLIASDTEIEAGRRVPVGMIVNATRKEA